LNDELAYQLKSFLKDNQKADTYFSLNDEKRIWNKLSPDLKQRTNSLMQASYKAQTYELSRNAFSS